ncbi:MAG: hydrogenase maturation protease [Helicobacteraceae bacterium]|jgi:hydrogenase maturation protease|nr:hydrogenase maturation protease [Helicobacteraceae bacterium]
MNNSKILLIGYGNTLREDDGFGVFVADRLKNNPKFECVCVHQLIPELTELIAKFYSVFFVDVNIENEAGVFAVPMANSNKPLYHNFSPWELMDLTKKLFGTNHAFTIFSVGGERFGYGETLSPPLLEAAKALIVFLKQIN